MGQREAPIGPWRDMLRCPETGEPLVDHGDKLTSARCSYPVIDGVPILMSESASLFSADSLSAPRRPSRLRALVRRLIPSATLALGQASRYERFVAEIRASGGRQVLVIGGGLLGAGMDPLIKSELEVVESDVYLSPRVDVVCDGHSLPFADETFDGVVLQAVLEHVLDPPRVVSEAHRVLTGGGVVYAETPFLQAVHEGPFDFTRWTELGLRRLFRMFSELDRGVVIGPATTLVWSLVYFVRSFARRRSTALVVDKLATLCFFWLKYLDRILISRPGATDAASGVYFMGRKAQTPVDDREILAGYRGIVGRPVTY